MDVRRNEVLVAGGNVGAQWNLSVWDPTNGTSLKTYKGGISAPGTLNIMGSSFIISAMKDKPLLNVWRLDRHEQMSQKITTPGKARALSVSPGDGCFLVASSGESIYLWQTGTGRLLGILTKHFQEVTRLSWTDDGSFILSVAKDGSLIAWSLPEILSSASKAAQNEDVKLEPHHIWNDSSLEITDIVVGKGGPRARILTVSLDHHARVYDLPSASLILEVTFSKPLHSITVDTSEVWAYVGTDTGEIHTFSLRSPPLRTDSIKAMITPDAKNTFSGHTDSVSCLSVSMDGRTLASGSKDTDVRIWDIKSRQTLRSIPLRGSVTVLTYLSPPPRGMLDTDDYKQELPLLPLDKNLRSATKETVLQVFTPYGIYDSSSEDEEDEEFLSHSRNDSRLVHTPTKSGEIERLKKINLSLYQSAVDLILNK
uniref:WD repeat-containing protein 18 n=1 Tax=Caligus rogercresseyi TaxID=217165 RepID=C1BR22_CALRO|nr:WD repeat-containing protein 18 [Caligus rogercresseyi]